MRVPEVIRRIVEARMPPADYREHERRLDKLDEELRVLRLLARFGRFDADREERE